MAIYSVEILINIYDLKNEVINGIIVAILLMGIILLMWWSSEVL